MPVGATSFENSYPAYGDEIISNSCATYHFAHTRTHPAKYLFIPSGRYSGRERAFAKARFVVNLLCLTQLRTMFGLPSKLSHKRQRAQMDPCEIV